MSFEKKLYNLEVTPPPQAWTNIAAALNDLQFEAVIKKKLNEQVPDPPVDLWEKTESFLNNEVTSSAVSGLLENIIKTPPPDISNKIDRPPTEENFNKKFGFLKSFENAPPPGNWEKIAASLNDGTKIIPLRKRNNNWLRFVAAAAVIGLIAWGGISLFTNGKNTIADGSVVKEENKSSVTDSPINTEKELSKTPETATLPNSIQEKPMPRTEGLNTGSRARQAVSSGKIEIKTEPPNLTHTGSEEIIADNNTFQKNKAPEINTTPQLVPDAPRYLLYMNDDGELMKVSKKLAGLKCIYDKEGRVSLDAMDALNRSLCDELIKSWQDKIANTPINLALNPLEMADILK
jgi:hypothetical protein